MGRAFSITIGSFVKAYTSGILLSTITNKKVAKANDRKVRCSLFQQVLSCQSVTPMSLARRLRDERERAGLSLDELSECTKISKTYLWELENDKKSAKRPSAAILLKVCKALSLTLADLLSLPTVQADSTKVVLNKALIEFREWMKKIGEPLSDEELRDLAMTQFRGGQPRTREDWHDLYRTLKRITRR